MDQLVRDELTKRDLDRSLHALGFRDGDVVTVDTGDRAAHFELNPAPTSGGRP
jgi:hypothetical protein